MGPSVVAASVHLWHPAARAARARPGRAPRVARRAPCDIARRAALLTKKGGTATTITWASAVEELLCFGWIDGQAGKRDEDSYTVRITPRRPKGSWSLRNVALVATLEEQGRMTDAGRAAVEAARADGRRWAPAHAGPATRRVPDDLAVAIAAEPDAQAMFDVLTSANRFALIHRVENMKRAESRARKITEMVEMLARGETLYPQKARRT